MMIDPATLVLVLGALIGALTGVLVVGPATGAAVGSVTGATENMTRVRALQGAVFLLTTTYQELQRTWFEKQKYCLKQRLQRKLRSLTSIGGMS
jgi:LPS O-antigen subunit length determinant protein (WzzB/FepE family)